MNNKNFQTEENEILSSDDAQVRQMLGALNRIDAPKGFDFRLKARIANAKPQDFQAPRLFPILRYAAPLGLAIIVLAVVVINGLYSFDNNSVPTVAGNYVQQSPAANVNFSVINQANTMAAAETTPQTANTEIFPAMSVNSDKPEKRTFSRDSELAGNTKKPKTENNGIRSRDSALKDAKVFLPDGFNSNNSISVKEILLAIGIEADFSNKKWKVKSVIQNGIAERSGVKPDDVIEAIDANKLSTEPINSKGAFNGKTLTIVRGSEKLEINLQNK